MIGIGHDGDCDIRRGLIRPEDKAAAKKAAKANAPKDTADKPETAGLSAALVEELTAQRDGGVAGQARR